MACALTQGYAIDCRDSIGGATTFHVIEFPAIAGYTITAGVITEIKKATGKRFWGYRPARNTGYGKETITSSVENGTTFYAQEVFFPLNKLNSNMRNEIILLAQNNLVIVVTDSNGKHWLFGKQNGLTITAGEAGTGTASGDRNGYSLTFTGEEPLLAYEVDAATFATLETAGS